MGPSPLIGVIGANGQVASEVCVLLAADDRVRVAPVVRTPLASALLKRCGLQCRIGAVSDRRDAKRVLGDCDLTVDFSLPSGARGDVRREGRRVIRNAVSAARRGGGFVYISSTMAFGMASEARRYRAMRISRTRYSAEKRHFERWARLVGWFHGQSIYIFRLGQVHGGMQAVSSQIERAMADAIIQLPDAGGKPSDAVFCSSIAAAIAEIAQGSVLPGRYTVLNAPELTLRELYELYGTMSGALADIRDPAPSSRVRTCSWPSLVIRRVVELAERHEEFLMAHVPVPAQIERRLKSWHLARRAEADAHARRAHRTWSPRHYAGPVPGRRLPGLSGASVDAVASVQKIRRLLESLCLEA